MEFIEETVHAAEAVEEELVSEAEAMVVWLRHPHTGELQKVLPIPAKLVAWMAKGYVQVQPDTAKGA